MVKKGFVAEISNDPNLYFYNGMSAYLKGEVIGKISFFD
jgi:hypothetical protein